MTQAWYLGCRADAIAERAILVGDPGRIELFAEQLDDVRMVGDNRGLRSITGTSAGLQVTVCAFGMGAPIAAIVLEELAQLGVRTVLRVGTVMTLAPDALGELVVATAAVREEAVSRTYVPISVPAVPDLDLLFGMLVSLEQLGERYRTGLVASLDGFYTEMFAARPEREQAVRERLAGLAELGVIAVDMETSTVLAVARTLCVAAGSLCIATVQASGPEKLEGSERVEAERRLVKGALRTLHAPRDSFARAVKHNATPVGEEV
jgi:uridine phosphorylase